ncbi:TPA: MucBP domain-containing protein, partial [Streptococcus suis]
MLDKKKVKFRRQKMTTPDKRYRYSIRKFNVGIASVAIAAFMFLGGGAVSVSASELVSNEPAVPTSNSISEEVQPSTPEMQESDEVPSSAPLTETPAETPTALTEQTETVVAEETTQTTEVTDPTSINESSQDSSSQTENADALVAAKKVLEQVTSEAEVLSSDALRKAAKSTEDTSALQEAAKSTQAVIAEANKVFADENASLEDVNAQIVAIRSSVGSLVPELISYTGIEEVTVALNTPTSTETPADDADKAVVSAISDVYTAKTQRVTTFAGIPSNAIVVIESSATPATYTYKRFDGAVNLDAVKKAYDAGGFVDASTFKTNGGKVNEGETIYVVKESTLKSATATSVEETYDLIKFKHRENLVIDPNSYDLGALARPGSFSIDIEMLGDVIDGYDPTRHILKENNTLLVIEPGHSVYYGDLPENERPANLVTNEKGDLEDEYGNSMLYYHDKLNLLLSHIEGHNLADKPNSILDLPPGVSVVFKGLDGNETSSKADINKLWFKRLDDVWNKDKEEYIWGATTTLEFKFKVEKDGKVINQDTEWRKVTLHSSGNKKLADIIKTTTKNTVNDFDKGIVDNIDFSALPTGMKDIAVAMEKESANLDGTTPEDGKLPIFNNPENKNVKWIVERTPEDSYGDGTKYAVQDNSHGTSPIRILPNWTDLFKGDPSALLVSYLKETSNDAGRKDTDPIVDKEAIKSYKSLLDSIYRFHKYNVDTPVHAWNTADGTTTKSLQDYAEGTHSEFNKPVSNYWRSSITPMGIPTFDVGSDLDLEELTIIPSGPTYVITHRFEKGSSVPKDIELPTEITSRITDDKNYKEVPSGATRETNQTISTTPYTDKVNNGIWTFENWSATSLSPSAENPNPEFVGTWKFTKNEDVVVQYIALKSNGTVDTSVTLKGDYTDSDDVQPGTKYNATETKNGIQEKPTSIVHDASGITYELVEDRTESYTNGQKDETAKTAGDVPVGGAVIKYYYKPTGVGSVKIVYQALTEDGSAEDASVHLRDDYMDTEDKPVDTPYNAREEGEQPASITYVRPDGSTIEYKLVAEKSKLVDPYGEYTADEIGGADFPTEDDFYSYQVQEGLTTYTYYYQPDPNTETPAGTVKMGSVKIKYTALNEAGEKDPNVELRGEYIDTPNSKVGTEYDAAETKDGVEEKPTEFKNIGGKDYTFVRIEKTVNGVTASDTNTSGEVAEGETIIEYVYKPVSTVPPVEPKGSVKIVYKALNADGTDVDSSVTLRADVNDTVDAAVGTPWNAKETGVDHDKNDTTEPINERQEMFTTEATETNPSREYRLVAAKTTVQTPTDATPVTVTDDAQLEGQVVEGTTTVTYYYALVQVQPATSRQVKGSVIIKYEDAAETEIKGQLTDTDQGLVATYTTPSRRYIKVDNQITYLDSEPTETEVLSNLTYNADQTREDGTVEKPAMIPFGDKTYHFIKLKEGSAETTGLVTETTKTVTYVYAPEQQREETSPTLGSVLVRYKLEGSETDTNPDGITLRANYPDRTDVVVKNQTKTIYFYEDANGQQQTVREVTADPVPTNERYEITADEAPEILVSEGKQYRKVRRSDVAESGLVPEGTTTITYYYKPVLGGVIVKYVNEAGLEIADQYTDTDLNTHLTSPVQSYDATQTKPNSTDSEKPLTLTGKDDGKSYIFKEVRAEAGDSQPSGNLKEGTTTVVYVYSEKPKGSVLVRYKALDAATGRQEDNSVTLREDYLDTPETYVDTDWSTVDKNVDHDKNQDTPLVDEQPTKFENINGKDYVLVKTVTRVPGQDATSDATSGNVVRGQTVVTYFYAPVQTETATTENKGSVVIQYRRLGDKKEIASAKDDRRDVVVSTTTNTKTFYVVDGQRTYLEGGEAGVTTTEPTAADQLLYKADETGEQPPTINFQDTEAGETAAITYHFIRHDTTSAGITGSVEVGTKTVVYLYSPEQSETTSKDNTAKVTVNYYILDTDTTLQPSYEDMPATKISETVSTRTYYLDADGNQVPVGTPTEEIKPVVPAVTYNTNLTKADGTAERPTTLTSGGKTYHLVETATSFTDGTGVSGTLTKDTVVNYYYAEVKEEEVSRTPITGNVLVHYKRASDKQELQGTYTDTPATPVAYTVVTRSYYEDAQGQKHQVGESRSSREAVTPVSTYTVEGTTEAPATLSYENTTYHYIGLETGSKPLTGDVVEGTTEVTLLYKPEQSRQETSPTPGSVIVRYKLEGSETEANPDGITLRGDYPDTTDVVVKNQTKTIYFYEDANGQPQTVREVTADPVPTNERYEITADEAPEILFSDGKQYRKVRRSEVAESGLVLEGTTTITYYYAPIQGGVIVKYVNEAGDEIADQYTDTDLNTHLTDPVQSYDADGKKADGQTDEKPGELVGKDGKTYVFKEFKSGDGLSQPSGDLKEGTTTVVYVYKEKDKGSVLVRYVALQADNQTVDDTVHLADDYQDTPETYIGQDWNTTGNKTDGSLERPADFRNVNGKDYLLVESKTTTTHDGQPVENNPTSGQVQKGQTVVTYYYAPVPQGSVRIEYKALHPNGDINEDLNLRKAYFDTLNANVGTDYNASESGRVDHDDNPGTPLEDEKPSQIVLGAATYRLVEARTTKRLNDGQDSLTDLTSGQVEKGTITITYYYAPVLGQVIVKYKALNADGTAVDDSVHLADDYPEVTAGNVNDSYAITGQKPNSQEDEKPSTFVKPDKTYHLVASKTTKQVGTNPATIVGDNHDGNVAEGTTLITFFYAPEQVEKGTSRQVKGDVTIRYENTAGEEIKTSLPDTVQGLVATYTKPDRRYIKVDNQVSYLDTEAAETEVLSNLTYDADQTREDGTVEKPLIITHNDKNYHFIKLKDGSAATTGLVTEATQTVTYVYALEQTAVQEEDLTGSVVVKYQKLADRSQIKADYSDTTNVKVGVKRISQNYYEDKDGVRQLVGNATEVKELLSPAPTYTVEGDTEKPAIIDVNGINYHFVGIDETKSALTGDVTEVTKEVVLLYNPEMVETTPNTRRASVYVDYKILGTNEELQARYTDTNQAVIATSETTKRYYLNQDGSETVLENTTSPETLVDVTYDTTENNERPLTLTKAGKEYHLVAGETVGETKGTLTADAYVTYYYAEIKTETGQTEEKGKVLIHYEDTEGNTISPEKVDVEDVLVSTAPTTRRYYEDGNGTKQYIEDLQVGTKVPTNAQYDATQVREGGVEEKPSTIIYNDKNYHFIKLKVGSASETGTVTVETQTVTYVYSPEVTVSTPSDNSAKVTVNYYILGTDETLQPSYEDTPVTKISETVSTRTYYLGADGNEVPVGDPTVVTNPVNPPVTYNTTETKNGKEERPTTLTSGDKTYHLVEAATSFTDGTGVRGTLTKDTVVNYYYAEVKEEVATVPTNGSVTIKYETTEGASLREDKEDTASTVISTKTTTKKYYEYNGEKVYVGDPVESTETVDLSYDTTEEAKDEKPSTLEKDGKTYQRVAVKSGSAAENGKVTGDHVVTYVYAEIVTPPVDSPKGSVIVKYRIQDEKGNVIESEIPRPDYEDTSETVTGTPYKTNENSDEKPTEFTYNGKVYEYVRVDGAEEGQVGEGQTVVTYIYKEKITTPTPEDPKPENPKPEDPKPEDPKP